MNPFVNFRKRSVQLPKGCKDLAGVLHPPVSTTAKLGPVLCEYCGSVPVPHVGLYQFDGVTTKVTGYQCEECSMDITEFMSKPENEFPLDADLRNRHVQQKLMTIGKRLERFMRKRVRQRKKDKGARSA